MKQVNSPDIQVLDYDVLLDISGTLPSITLTNQSLASSPASLEWVFEVYSPLGSVIHKGDFATPDVDGVWPAPFVKNSGFPRPNNQIEWSGNPYRVKVKVKDSEGNLFEYEKLIHLKRPGGNTEANTFGKGSVSLITKCNIGRLLVEDRTNFSYCGHIGAQISKTLKVLRPADDTGDVPAPETVSNFGGSALVKINQSGPGYQYFYQAIYQYALGNRTHVRIKYLDRDTFSVRCNIDLTPIACELKKLIDQLESGSCRDAKEAERIIKLVSPKLHIATIGILHPQSGIDPYEIIEQINKITGWKCSCTSSTGINSLGALNEASGILYDVLSEGGDIEGVVDFDGSNVLIRLKDFSYVFALCNDSTTEAFTVRPSVAGRTKTFCLHVDMNVFAEEILTIFEDNVSFKNRLSQLVSLTVSAGNISVNPRCLKVPGAPSRSYNYIFASTPFAEGETFFFRQFILADRSVKDINRVFNGSNVAEIGTAINALGIGVFQFSFDDDRFLLESTDNSTDIGELVGEFSSGEGAVDMAKVKVGNVLYSTQNVLQSIIDFVCQVILNQVSAGRGYTIKCLQAVGGAIKETAVGAETPAGDLLASLIDCYNGLVDIVRNLKEPNCETLHQIFTGVDDTLEAADRMLVFINGKCMLTTPQAIAKSVFTQAYTSDEIKNILCKAVAACAKPVCEPVVGATVTYDADERILTVVINNTGAPRYRVSHRLVTEGRPQTLGTTTINATAGPTTTHIWSDVEPGQWEVLVFALCADGMESGQFAAQTLPCSAPASLNVVLVGNNFNVTWNGLSGTAEKFRLEISLPNGGTFAANYALNTPQPLLIPRDPTIPGDYLFVGRSVCDETAQWYSPGTSAVRVNVPAQSSCPSVSKVEISHITTNSARIVATKPVGGTEPNAFTLRLTPKNGGVPIKLSSNEAGGTVTWNVSGLTANTTYAVEVISECTSGQSNPYSGGFFTTEAGVNNSEITNNGSVAASSASVQINGSLVHVAQPLNAGASSGFGIATNYNAAEVKITPCDAEATSCQLTIGATTYNPSSQVGQTFIFQNVQINQGMDITFSN